MTDYVAIVSDSSSEKVEIVTIQDGTVVVTQDQGSETFEIIENASVPIIVSDIGSGESLGGIPVVVGNAQVGDVISYDGVAFRNRRQIELTDGGNF